MFKRSQVIAGLFLLFFLSSTVFASEKTVVGIAVDSKQHETLVAAVKAAELVETLSSTGPFTVFAPTDAAFNKLPKGTLESLLKPENKEQLTSILTFHVVSGKLMAADLKDGMKLKTVNGAELTVKIKNKKVYINDAQVQTADVDASNGVVHVIKEVLLP